MRYLRHTLPAVALAATAAVLSSCQVREADENTANGTENAAIPRPPLPVAEAPLDREALLIAAFRAASAKATGGDDGEAQRSLDGRTFEIRIRFGCDRTRPEDPPFEILYDDDRRTLRLRAAPDITDQNPLAALVVPDTDELIEGFWLKRPWLLTAACPTAAAPGETAAQEGSPATEKSKGAAKAAPQKAAPKKAAPAKVTPTPVDRPRNAREVASEAGSEDSRARFIRVGIAQFFREGDPRTFQRRDRPYEATRILTETESPSTQGYDLVLSGRLRRVAGGPVIACGGGDARTPPDCIISVAFDRVWFENPSTGRIIAEWGRS